MEVEGSPALFSPDENQEEAEVWAKFMALGQAKGLDWVKKMVAVQGAQQQSEDNAAANTHEVQPTDSGLCLRSVESVTAPARRKRPPRATAGNKLKPAKKVGTENVLPEVSATPLEDSGLRRNIDSMEQGGPVASGAPLTAGASTTRENLQRDQGQSGQPADNGCCAPAPGPAGQGLQVGLGKMMEAMHNFMASAKALAGGGMNEQRAGSGSACAGQVWGQGESYPPKSQGLVTGQETKNLGGSASDTLAGTSDKGTVVRPDPPLLSGRSSLAWRFPLEARERIWNREFIDIFSLLTFAKEGADITVPSKEVEKHKWKRKVKPEESMDNWLEAFAMLSTVIMEKFPEQGPALCKYNRVIYEEYTRNGGTGWLCYDREFRQKMEQAPEMTWDCREIELWVQYMGNGCRTTTSETRFPRHKQARPFYFKQQLRSPFRGKPQQRGRGGYQYRSSNNSCRPYNAGHALGVLHANSLTPAPSAPVGTLQPNAPEGVRPIRQWVPMGVPSSPNHPQSHHTTLAPSPIDFNALASILKDYPRATERELLFNGFSEGFRIPYDGPSLSRGANNLRSAMEARGVVREKLEKECQLGRVAGPFIHPPLSNFIVSPLGIVPKKEQGKYRLIHHLSFPKGSSVNDYLEEGTCSVCYASFDEAVDLVRAAGLGALMAKADIESAFRLLPVHPSSFHLLGMQWAGQYFYDKCMPMGCAVSCALFETFACFLEWALREGTPPGSSLHYLDDFLCIGRAGSGECKATLSAFEHLSQTLGVPLAPGWGGWGPPGDKGAALRTMGKGQWEIARMGLQARGGYRPLLEIEERGGPNRGFPIEGGTEGMG
ncbi:hypothetical protein NDU88_008039 [Pleurodeles waltl]|uniref:Reverse transcriptase domain-containing protein n=1 Tax=Pleurodeles waltl TaxID=8319 RepID=A0AAV7NZ36_PLEWA|nr:hypothetical protein NDU88_008039 [Pleurodeles waltl]